MWIHALIWMQIAYPYVMADTEENTHFACSDTLQNGATLTDAEET